MIGTLELFDIQWPENLQLPDSTRRVWVWLPENYAESDKLYHCLFMHDGQNVFRNEDATFGTCWRMSAAQSSLEHPMVVVAVEGQNDAIRRFNEFSPWKNDELGIWKGEPDLEAGGSADEYLSFLVETVVPKIQAHYRVSSKSEDTWLGGSSMGGLVNLYASTQYETVFGKYLCMSTATWFAHEPLIDLLGSHEYRSTTKIYADIGTQETSNPEISQFPSIYLDGNKELFAVLESQLATGQFRSMIDQGAIHNEAAWAERLPSALKWLQNEPC